VGDYAGERGILVAGGGPAGCIAAIALVGLGHRVRLIARPRRPAIEGLSERVLRALEASGCRRALDAVGPAVRREASWNGVTTAANQEWVVARERLDAALLQDAAVPQGCTKGPGQLVHQADAHDQQAGARRLARVSEWARMAAVASNPPRASHSGAARPLSLIAKGPNSMENWLR
jgi:2-polyprenyl-6-methoxyphenol hydroxylase-like FAD-dependent oxidoreductase